MIRKLTSLILLLIPIAVFAQEDERQLVTLNQVKSGMMLLKTSQPGLYVAAPTVETDVQLQVRGMILRGEVRQTFRNPEPTCAEAVYAFPLPENAAVDRLQMTVGQRLIEGEIKERKVAEQVYQQAKSEGKKASLLSQERPNLFTVSIANIGSGEEVVITIDYQQSVDYRDGAFSLRFPTTIGPRYIPGHVQPALSRLKPAGEPALPGVGWSVDTDQVSDASRVTPPVNLPGSGRENRLRLSVDLDSGFSLRRVDSTYHQIASSVVSGSHYRVTLAAGDVPADRDFELVWQPDLGSEPRTAVFAETGQNERYALLMLMPPASNTGVRLPRESIFIIDTSGSMSGTSLNEAKNALQLALNRLSPQDRFNVIEFNSVTHVMFTQPRPATPDVVAQAKQWVDRLQATGGTEMMGALQAALLDQSQSIGVVRQVIFMTDGDVGNEEQLLAFIRTSLGSSRLFTVGIGAGPNSHFLRSAARLGRGTFTYIGSVNEVQEKMTALFEKLERPVLTNVELHFDDPSAEMWPQRVPDLYAGEPVVVAVRLSGGGQAPTTARTGEASVLHVAASGKLGDHDWTDTHSLSVTNAEAGVGKLWARRKIESLTDSGADVHQQIIDLGLSHHLVTEFTSLVAVDVTPSAVPQQTCETRAVPVNLPKGWGGIEGSLPTTATPAPLFILIGTVLLAIAAAIAIRS